MPLNLTPRPDPDLLSFVIPMYNESEVLPELIRRLEALAASLQGAVEWVVVNDGSRDATAAMLGAWAARDRRVKLVDLARNFGHPAALTAGLDHASGDAVVIMDADLQDPPEIVVDMLAKVTTSRTPSARSAMARPPSRSPRQPRFTGSCACSCTGIFRRTPATSG
jgi:cellulose synthase/poly-beta-1,6-N-acetylglucosamine synthase-like glycosyltransferase